VRKVDPKPSARPHESHGSTGSRLPPPAQGGGRGGTPHYKRAVESGGALVELRALASSGLLRRSTKIGESGGVLSGASDSRFPRQIAMSLPASSTLCTPHWRATLRAPIWGRVPLSGLTPDPAASPSTSRNRINAPHRPHYVVLGQRYSVRKACRRNSLPLTNCRETSTLRR